MKNQTPHTQGYLDMELLRFSTAGSVDDGKSTLIGRLLYDSKSIFEDQMEAIQTASRIRGNEELNLALLTDGLKAEREQGITIDVAYRYFATPRRKFIIADTPGHIQYTRNMVTGASTADLAIILIDARNGIIEQTVRHTYIASLLAIPHIAVCINKMDLVDFSQEVYNSIVEKYTEMATTLGLKNIHFIPISAKFGDNVVRHSDRCPWYTGPSLMELLETTPIDHKGAVGSARFPVQWVIRPISDKYHDFRGYAGRMSGGELKLGQQIRVLPSGTTSYIKEIMECDKQLLSATTPASVTLTLTNDIDISRGDMIVSDDDTTPPTVGQDHTMMICWLNEKPMTIGGKYIIRHCNSEVKALIKSIDYRVNIETLKHQDATTLAMNDIAQITIRSAKPLATDPYHINRLTGSLVFIDEGTNETVGAAMII